MLVIGGIYIYRDAPVILIDASVNDLPIVSELKGKSRWTARIEDLAGPTHIPCPICGKLTTLQTDGLQIDMAEHIMRCRIPKSPTPPF